MEHSILEGVLSLDLLENHQFHYDVKLLPYYMGLYKKVFHRSRRQFT